MSRYIVFRINAIIQRLEYAFPQLFGRGGSGDAFALAGIPSNYHNFDTPQTENKFSLKNLLGDGVLWAVPKHRRTIEKRMKRKFGTPEYIYKMITPNTNLKVCNHCGGDHEVGVLCPHCYEKVRKETELIQEKIQENLGLNPVEQDVVVLYDGEKVEQDSEFANGKRIIEMKKTRPMWFSKNLMQKTTQPPATTTEVKPTDLG